MSHWEKATGKKGVAEKPGERNIYFIQTVWNKGSSVCFLRWSKDSEEEMNREKQTRNKQKENIKKK